MAGLVRLRLGVGMLIRRNTDILVGFHHKTQSWGPPGGEVEPGEHPLAAAYRETAEECGVELPAIPLRPREVTVTHCPPTCPNPNCSKSLWTTIYYLYDLDEWSITPREPEPDKMSDWRWVTFHPDYIPKPTIPPLAAIWAPDQRLFYTADDHRRKQEGRT